MSDRVEERREEQRILDQRLLNQRSEASRQQAGQAFAKVVSQVQQTKGQETAKTDGAKQETRMGSEASAQQKLLSRRGIDNNELAGRLLGDGNARMIKGRGDSQRQQAEGQLRNRLEGKVQEKQGDSQNPLAPVHGRDGGKGGKGSSDSNDRGGSDARREGIMGSQTGQAIMGLDGTGAKATSGSAGAGKSSTQQIIDEIVKSVAVHKDALKGTGTVHIELKDSAFRSTSLTLSSSPEGIGLKIHSADEQVSRLFSAGSTAHELQVALQAKGIKLKTLEVNDHKVIR